MKIGAVDLFCGIGGLTAGLQKASITVEAGIDLDESCRYSFETNNNSSFINVSITDISGEQITDLLADYDIKVLVGCAPCQPFSRHQKDKFNRNLHKDWGLLYQFARLVEEVEPDIVSMENVPELQKEKVFLDFTQKLSNLGYQYSANIVDAADYGVPQHRNRLILLASKFGEIKLIPKTHDESITVKKALEGLPPISAGTASSQDKIHFSSALSLKNLERIRKSKPNGTWRDWPKELQLTCHKAETGKTYSSVYGRMSWDCPAPTITTQFTYYGTGRFGHPEQDRAISLREGAILQTFPSDYQFCKNDDPIVIKRIARHIGNAVPPRLGEIVGLSINEHLLQYAKPDGE